jgi:hypothetical protein
MPDRIEREVTQVTETPTTVERQTLHSEHEPKPSGTVLAGRVVYYILGVIEVILGFRLVLSLLGANRSSGFGSFIFNLSLPFSQPFFSLFGYEPTYGASHLELGTAVAMVVYLIVAVGIVALIRLNHRGDEV